MAGSPQESRPSTQSTQTKKPPRKHVTTACVPCRESKIRCDGATPNCMNCQKKNKDCRYQHGDDKRKVSLRAATERFSARIDQLSQFIYDHGLEPPPMNPEAEQGINRVLDTLQIPRGVVRQNNDSNNATRKPETNGVPVTTTASQTNSVPSSVPSSIPSSKPPSEQPTQCADHNLSFALPTAECLNGLYNDFNRTGNAQDRGYAGNESGQYDTYVPNGWHPGMDEEESDSEIDEAEREVIEQLSARMGTLKLASDGHLRYYGPTSNLNLVEVSSSSTQRPGPDVRSVRHDGQELLNHQRLGQPVDASLEDHLIELYFTWQNPSLYVVDRQMFNEARARWRNENDDTPFYSEVLANAMCALGAAFEARYHPTFVTFPKSLAEFFADRAKALLEIELDSPCVATVQALVILSSHEAASNRDARGWLYSGMSMRLALDLGLHMDTKRYVEEGRMTPMEAEVRRIAFWGSNVADHFWGFYLGRPFRMNAGDVSVPKPASDLNRAKEEIWYPYGAVEPPKCIQGGLKSPSELISRQFANLWEMITPLGHILYGCATIPRHELQKLNYKVTQDLFAWKANLPSNLQVDLDNDTEPVLPHLLMLHMQYHQIVIFVHRPWVSKDYIQPQNPKQGPGYQHARRTCIESATAIARLLRIYEKFYTFRRINNQVVAIIFTAALMLIFVTITTSPSLNRHSKKDRDDHATMAGHLNVCFRALDELSQSFENAKRTRDFLVSLQRRWANHMRKSTKRVSASSNTNHTSSTNPDDERKKRSRLDDSSSSGQLSPSTASSSGASVPTPGTISNTAAGMTVTVPGTGPGKAPPPRTAPPTTSAGAATTPGMMPPLSSLLSSTPSPPKSNVPATTVGPAPPPPPSSNLNLDDIDFNWTTSAPEHELKLFADETLGAPLLQNGGLPDFPDLGDMNVSSWWDGSGGHSGQDVSMSVSTSGPMGVNPHTTTATGSNTSTTNPHSMGPVTGPGSAPGSTASTRRV